MKRLSGIAGAATAGGSPLTTLLNDAKRLGGIYHLDYDKAIVITDDFIKREAGVCRATASCWPRLRSRPRRRTPPR